AALSVDAIGAGRRGRRSARLRRRVGVPARVPALDRHDPGAVLAEPAPQLTRSAIAFVASCPGPARAPSPGLRAARGLTPSGQEARAWARSISATYPPACS